MLRWLWCTSQHLYRGYQQCMYTLQAHNVWHKLNIFGCRDVPHLIFFITNIFRQGTKSLYTLTHTHTRLFSFNFRFCLYLSLALSVARSPLNVWFQLLRRTYMQNHQWLLSYDYCFLNAVSVGFIISHKAPYIRALTHPHARYNYFYHTYTIQSTVDKVVINTTILNISLFCNFIKRMPIPTSLAEIITKVEWAKKQ